MNEETMKQIAMNGGAKDEEQAQEILEEGKKLGLVEKGSEGGVRATMLGHVMWVLLDRFRRLEESKDILRMIGEMLPGVKIEESERLQETKH